MRERVSGRMATRLTALGEFLNQEIEQRRERHQALVEAGAARQPVLSLRVATSAMGKMDPAVTSVVVDGETFQISQRSLVPEFMAIFLDQIVYVVWAKRAEALVIPPLMDQVDQYFQPARRELLKGIRGQAAPDFQRQKPTLTNFWWQKKPGQTAYI
eukprot:Skav220108  [mRNA]  locus=scaffold1727:21173:24706:+ [translate_table: standard]